MKDSKKLALVDGLQQQLSALQEQLKALQGNSSERSLTTAQQRYFKKNGSGRPKGSVLMRDRILRFGGHKLLMKVSPQGAILHSYVEGKDGKVVTKPLIFIHNLDRRTLRRGMQAAVKFLIKLNQLQQAGELVFSMEPNTARLAEIPKMPEAPKTNPEFDETAVRRKPLYGNADQKYNRNPARARSSAYGDLIDEHRAAKKEAKKAKRKSIQEASR